eukprot:jgi/Psemu1/56269/gm1.56269_g
MICIAFFFCLRPGEYTGTTRDDQAFHLKEVSFYLGSKFVPHDGPAHELLAATSVTLTFTTQKNGDKGEVVAHARSGDSLCCPVAACARQVLHLRRCCPSTHPFSPSLKLASYFDNGVLTLVRAATVTSSMRQSLPAPFEREGAMALLQGKCDSNVIKLLARWHSDCMMRYLHQQSLPIFKNLASVMFNNGTYSFLPEEWADPPTLAVLQEPSRFLSSQLPPCGLWPTGRKGLTAKALVVDYAKSTNRSAGKKHIRGIQDLEVEEQALYTTYNILLVDVCNDLGMPAGRWHTQWGQCLRPRKRWNETVVLVANRETDHSIEGFKAAMQAYINAIIPDPDSKGTMIAAFEHHHMATPAEVSEHTHFSRIGTVVDYIDMLPRDNDQDLTEQQRKRMFFKTHPRSWQDAYIDTAVDFREVTILQIRTT